MNKNGYQLGMSIDFGMSVPGAQERIKAIAEAGFDAVFTGWHSGGYIDEMSKTIKDCGLIYQSVHAPFNKVNLMWEDGSDGDNQLSMLCECVDDCAAARVGIMVSHVWIGFGDEKPNDMGIQRFAKLLNHARSKGVKIAFENTEGERFLESIRDNLYDNSAAAFCIDTGHELCYNRGRNMIGDFGGDGKLTATHINDNLGVTGSTITWLDDSHLLPFDGKVDWQGVAQRLVLAGYDGILTCELTTKSKPERDTHKMYEQLDYVGFIRLAKERIEKIADMMYDIRCREINANEK